MINFISKYYNKIIGFITLISIIFLISNNTPSLWVCEFYDSDESYSNGNGIWNNILTGFICSAIFYCLIDFIPNLRKQQYTDEKIDLHLNNINNCLIRIFEEYNEIIKKPNINLLEYEDFNKIQGLELFGKHYPPDIPSPQIREINWNYNHLKDIDAIINQINKTNYYNNIKLEVLEFIDEFHNLRFYNYFKNFGDFVYKVSYTKDEIKGYNQIPFNYEYIGKDLFQLYELYKVLNSKIIK